MKMRKTPSKFAKSLTSGAWFDGAFPSSRGNSTYSVAVDYSTKHPSDALRYKLEVWEGMSSTDRVSAQAYWALKHTNFDVQTAGDHRKVQLNELNELRDQAYENSLIYKEKTKKIHDAKIKNRVFNVGDRVLLFNL
ncbi:hypothetical protein Tco_1063398 [Tanacetum coccineum]